MSANHHLTSCQGTTLVRRRDTYLLRREKRKPVCWTLGCPKVWNQLPINIGSGASKEGLRGSGDPWIL